MEHFNDYISVGNRERIKFKCSSCGSCCKNVRDSVMLEAFDAFRLIKHFKSAYPDKSPDEILSIFSEIKELSPGYFVYVLKTFNNDGICTFLKNNKCTVYKDRPRTCRTYPFAIEKTSNGNILKWILCTEQSHHFNCGHITAREWQRKMLTSEDIDFLKTEIDMIPQIGKLMHQIPDSLIEKATQLSLAFTYFAYDFSLPFLPQYKENMLMLISLLKQMQPNIQE